MLTIIQIEPLVDNQHPIQSQSDRTKCWEEGYIAVPDHLVDAVWECMGYCDLTIEDGVLIDITPTERPVEPAVLTVEERVTALEEAAAQADETAIELYEAQLIQEETNAAQDEALIELYEMIGG